MLDCQASISNKAGFMLMNHAFCLALFVYECNALFDN